MEEKRRSKRLEIDVKIKLNEVRNYKNVDGISKNDIDVTLVNLSRDGLAFKCEEELKLSTFFDVDIVLWTKETFKSVIEVVRMENIESESGNEVLYGCRFIGIKPADQLKIQIYEILNDAE